MRRYVALLLTTLPLVAALTPAASAQVFLNEIFINPEGGFDLDEEFVELMGTPGMKLDGYAIAFVNGLEEKYYPLGSVPPAPTPPPEIDEFFSLDGLSLGANGLLVIGSGDISSYELLTPHSNFARWTNIWNGGLDTPGKLENDGSTTVVLIRNRPGATQANPFHPQGLRWGKDIAHDIDFAAPVSDPADGSLKALWGDGRIDEGGFTVLATAKLDLTGASTPNDPTDDVEIVDEVSYEHSRGWEYDLDTRVVDSGSTIAGLPARRVHALDDSQGFNPDVLTRVDSRMTGPGWTPAAGATGAMTNGNNWQDTATEQWVRGENVTGSQGVGALPQFFYDNLPNTNPDAIQPYVTNVPRWLDDGIGADFDFTQVSYQIMAGRVNPLAIPFIPGDATRDGIVDAADAAKIAARFGDANWLFANGSTSSAEGAGGDPATQARPWDIDTNSEYGVDPNDLQWALSFQGDTTGRIAGLTYDSSTPSTSGVKLNSGFGVNVTLTASASSNCGRPLNGLFLNDIIEVTVRGQVTSGANTSPGEENGIQQFLNDVVFSNSNVLEVVDFEALGNFVETRASLMGPAVPGGASDILGYSTSASEGLAGPADLYVVRLRAVGAGTSSINWQPAFRSEFAATAPAGIKVAHTADHGNPSGVILPNFLSLTVLGTTGPVLDAYGVGCAGTNGFVPTLTGEGCASPGGSITLSIENGTPGVTPLLFLGLSNLVLPLNPFCALQNGPLFPSPVVLPPLAGGTPGAGVLVLPGLGLPVTSPIGAAIYVQALFGDSGAIGKVSSTNPLEIRIGQ